MAKHVIWKRADGDADLTDIEALLMSIRSILEDDELSTDERETWLATTFHEYGAHTGRNALSDIAATRGDSYDKSERTQAMQNVDVGGLAMIGLECLAASIRKREPELTEAQSFLRACNERPDILKIEREASRRRIAGVGVAQTEPEILNDVLSDADIKRLIARERARFPFLDGAQLLAVVEANDEMKAHRLAVRQAQAAARRAGSTVEVAKRARDDAFDAIAAKAAELHKAMPSLTYEKCFARAYADPANRSFAKAERGAAMAAIFAG
jgi:hypothetical protein